MPLRKLPPVFEKYRFSIPRDLYPGVVIHIPDHRVLPTRESLLEDYGPDGDVPLVWYSNYWVEIERVGLHVRTEQVPELGLHARITTYDGKDRKPGTAVDEFSIWNMQEVDQATGPHADYLNKAREIIHSEFFFVMAYCAQMSERSAPVPVNTRTRNAGKSPAFYERQGDTLRFARIDDLASVAGQQWQRDYTPPENPSGIRKREHDVRGHWRTYKSGVRVWVKSHKRGDPELGTVTRVLRP